MKAELIEYPTHEEIVKIAVLAPLLMFAGLLRRPLLPVAEQPIEIAIENNDQLITGRIDVLILCDELWVTVIETKRASINVSQGIPQALAYMMSGLQTGHPRFGLITNGSEFRFIKLWRSDHTEYALSDLLTLQKHGNDLYQVVHILRELGLIAVKQAAQAA